MEDNLAKMLKNRRLELGLTMKDVAKAVNVSEGTISRWESGNISNMRRDRIASLAKVLHLAPADIMGMTEFGKQDKNEQILGMIEQLSDDKKVMIEKFIRTLLDE